MARLQDFIQKVYVLRCGWCTGRDNPVAELRHGGKTNVLNAATYDGWKVIGGDPACPDCAAKHSPKSRMHLTL